MNHNAEHIANPQSDVEFGETKPEVKLKQNESENPVLRNGEVLQSGVSLNADSSFPHAENINIGKDIESHLTYFSKLQSCPKCPNIICNDRVSFGSTEREKKQRDLNTIIDKKATNPCLIKGNDLREAGSKSCEIKKTKASVLLCDSCRKYGSIRKQPTHAHENLILATKCEVRKHCDINSCWIVANNFAFDVTAYMLDHPGGSTCLLKRSKQFQDATEDFNFHSKRGKKIWEKYKVARIIDCNRLAADSECVIL